MCGGILQECGDFTWRYFRWVLLFDFLW